MKSWSAVALGLASTSLLLATTVARAGNDEAIPVGDDAALTANAVAATVSDGSSMFYNPAGLASAERDQIDVSATVTLLRFYRVPKLVTTSGGASGDGSFTEFVSVPSAVSYVRSVSPRLKVGIGLFVPETNSWAVDASLARGHDTFYLSTAARQSLYYGTVGIGWRATRRFQLGASFSGLYFAGLASAAAWARYGDDGSASRIFGLSEMYSSTALGATLAFGAQWEPFTGLRIGWALRAPTVTISTSIRGSEVLGGAKIDPPSAGAAVNQVKQDTSGLHQVRSLRFRLGVAKSWGKSWFSVEADAQPGVTDEAIGARRQAVWNVRSGALCAVGEHTWVGVGAFTDRTGERRPRSVLDSRISFYGTTLGIRVDNPHRLGAREHAETVIFSTTVAARYAYGTGEIGSVLFESAAAEGAPATNSVTPAQVHELGIYLGSTLYF